MKIYKTYSLKNLVKLVLFFITLFLLLYFSNENYSSVKNSILIFIEKIIPSLFPFIFFTEIILNTNVIDILSQSIGKFTSKLLKLNNQCIPAIIIGFLCGYPMGAKTVSTLYENNKISKKEANILLRFVNNCNPIFILSTVGISIFSNIKVGIILLISHYLSAFLIAMSSFLFNRNNNIQSNTNTFNTLNKNNNQNFFEIIKMSIIKSFITLANIFGFIIIFNLLFNILKTLLSNFNISSNIISFLSGLFEVTDGINNVYLSSIDTKFKICIVSFLLGFSGLCIICQIYSVISKHKFSFTRLICYKLIQGIISFILTYIILNFVKIDNLFNIQVYKNIDTTLTYSDYLNKINNTYTIYVFIAIFLLLLVTTLYTLFHSKKKSY